MTKLNERLKPIDMPDGIKVLPVSATGYPVPWFVATIDGVPDFRVVDPHKLKSAVKERRCFICGGLLTRYMCFPIGPMCTINRISAEPPSHYKCCLYAVQACPFLTQPRMRRNEKDMPDDRREPPGLMLARNPGVTALWSTRDYVVMGNPRQGMLFRIGRNEAIEWWAEGRKATREECERSIETGLPALLEACDAEPTAPQRAEAHRQLITQTRAARRLLPPQRQEAAA